MCWKEYCLMEQLRPLQGSRGHFAHKAPTIEYLSSIKLPNNERIAGGI